LSLQGLDLATPNIHESGPTPICWSQLHIQSFCLSHTGCFIGTLCMYHKSTIQLNQLNSSVGRTYIFADFQSKSYHIKYNTKTKLIEPTNTVELILFKISHWRCSFATFYGLSSPKSSILHNFLLKIIQIDLIKYLLYLFILPTFCWSQYLFSVSLLCL